METEIRNPWCRQLANLADSNSEISTASRGTFYANEKLPGICIGKQQSGSITRENGGEKESCHFSHFNPPLCLFVLQAAQITSVLRTGNEQPYCLPRLTNARTPGLLILGEPATISDGTSAS
ncbi:uncharacterized protein Dana_GF26816 [Drosophila ananassae]|uniref:Uncharacterized protein n=1 Tax=Drosophila ananassae TaxID=7217 RepID=A0A0P8XW24_DROAN|nr:uncharacterized protein LOC26514225 [Drosophila ananassae]KPU78895.1 uncharacterized protein Dana_GF26816 [Drosophila ananassae]